MSPNQPMTYETVLEAVEQWPTAKRLTLINDVLLTLVPQRVAHRRNTLAEALGLLNNGNRTPTDETVQQ